MTPVFAIIVVLLIVFFLICVECILRKRISYIISTFDENEENIESRIREIIFLNPKSEILVLCTPRSPQTHTILKKLQSEYPQLHIIK